MFNLQCKRCRELVGAQMTLLREHLKKHLTDVEVGGMSMVEVEREYTGDYEEVAR